MRKLVFYTHAFSGGGAETVFCRLADALARAGDDVIFCADHAGPRIEGRQAFRRIVLGRNHLTATRHLSRILLSEKPDASFSALGAQNLKHLAAAAMAGRISRCVLGYHGFAVAEPRCFSQASFLLAAPATRLAARTICVSDTLLADLREHWHASQTRTLRIYNPLAADTFDLARPTTPPLIVACGRLTAIKRFPDLIAAFARLEPRDAHLAILGEGPERILLEATIARHGLEDRVSLPGLVPDPSLWYRRASCVAITSASESFGLTAAEALAHGVPVVSTECRGVPEILEHGLHGRIVPVGDVSALADALTATLRDAGDASRRQDRARTFSLSAARDAYSALADTLA